MVRLSWMRTDIGEDVLARHAADLAPAERDRFQCLRRADDRRARIVARSALRRQLGRALGVPAHRVPIVTAQGGKPMLAQADANGKPWHFSVSHSGAWALVALADRPVGVDVETSVPPDPLQLARHVLSASEADRVHRSAAPETTFLEIWVAKEAVLKMAGTGFRLSPQGFSVPLASTLFQRVSAPGMPAGIDGCMVAHLPPGESPQAAVCVASMAGEPQIALEMTWMTHEH